jgi:hypothetical protein
MYSLQHTHAAAGIRKVQRDEKGLRAMRMTYGAGWNGPLMKSKVRVPENI